MKGNSPDQNQKSLFSIPLKEMLNPKNGLFQLAEKIPWEEFEKEFTILYTKNFGRPAKPIRLMVSLLMLKQLSGLGDETVVEQWLQNPYWQYFSGENLFQWRFPIEPSDLVHFRKRIGIKGVEKILEVSIRLHGKSSKEKDVVVDTTVQEKNITFPTDVKMYKKIIDQCNKISRKEGIELRQSYKRTAKKLLLKQRFRNHPKNKKKALSAERKLKTIAGRLVRELYRKMSREQIKNYEDKLKLYEAVLKQKKGDKNKIYSLHEPEVYCISKGKEHKRYEFGTKASFVITKNSGIIVGALNVKNDYDGHTLETVLEQSERLRDKKIKKAIVDRGYQGVTKIGETEIHRPKKPKKNQSYSDTRRKRKDFRRRASIEPIISHLKTDFLLSRNFLKGEAGDSINLILSGAAFNLRKLIRKLEFIFAILKMLFIEKYSDEKIKFNAI
ncbi:IS5 family transposase [bacterium]|nr:IS5 family transposase [bacterium]